MQNTDISIETNPLKGIFICMIAYFFISLIGLFEKTIATSVSVPTIMFFQNMICLILIAPESLKTGVQSLKIQQANLYMIRIVSGLVCYATLFYIIRFIPVSEALLYQYSASLWIPFIMLIWMNVHMPRNLWLGILIGFAGIALILKPTGSEISWVTFFGIICGLSQGLSVVAIRKLSISEPIARILFYYFAVGTIVTLPLAISTWSPLSLHDIISLLGVGLNTYLAQKFITISLKYANATTLAPICYTAILFTGVIGWMFWSEVPERMTLIGMALVISGCLLSVLMTHQNTKLQQVEQTS